MYGSVSSEDSTCDGPRLTFSFRTHQNQSWKIARKRLTKFCGESPFLALTLCAHVIFSILRNNSLFLYITFGQPHFRRRYLSRPETTLQIRELGEAFHYYLYIVRT